MINLRPYQQETVAEIFGYWGSGGGNPLVELATGTGKSLVIAETLRRILTNYPNMRVLMLVHVRELVRQNYEELLALWPQAPVGINSAGLGRRDRHSQILFASVQSVANYQVGALGDRDLVIIDEAHLVPMKQAGQYRTLLDKLRDRVPDLRVLGLTATPYRLDSGRLDEGPDKLFDKIVYSYDIAKGIDDGYLAPLVARGSANSIDVSGVGRRGGEFIAGELEDAASAVTQAACDEIVSKAVSRNSWLAFCAGVDHAYEVRDALRERGVSCETITGKTPKGERDRIIRDFKDGRIRCLTNANVLTTGFNVPGVDMIAMLRPTLSTSLYVQMLGRGTRTATGKENCLVMDFSGNVMRHGPVDDLNVRARRKKGGEGRAEVGAIAAKECPECGVLNGIRALSCCSCGHEWPEPPKHEAMANENVVLLRGNLDDKWIKVDRVLAFKHTSLAGNLSMRIEYECGLQIFKEYVPIAQPGYPGARAVKWWRAMTGRIQESPSLDEALAYTQMFDKWAHVEKIKVKKDGAYWRVCGWRCSDGAVNYEINENFHVKELQDAE
jgi:DNA repair protein RadD